MNTYVMDKGPIVIPAEIRKKSNIKAETRIHVIEGDDEIILKRITELFYCKLQGLLRGKGVLQDLVEDRGQEKRS